MKKKDSKSIIFPVIIGVVFVIAVVLIFQQELQFNKQLTAAVFQPQKTEEKETKTDSQLASKLAEQAKKLILSACLDKIFEEFKELWNEECEKEGLEEKCLLPKALAEDLMDERQQLEEGCYENYSVE